MRRQAIRIFFQIMSTTIWLAMFICSSFIFAGQFSVCDAAAIVYAASAVVISVLHNPKSLSKHVSLADKQKALQEETAKRAADPSYRLKKIIFIVLCHFICSVAFSVFTAFAVKRAFPSLFIPLFVLSVVFGLAITVAVILYELRASNVA